MKSDELKRRFLIELQVLGIERPEMELRFHPKRRWRFDYAWPHWMVAVEIQGGVYTSRHFSQKTLHLDTEKFLEANILGWIVIQCNYWMLERGLVAPMVSRAIESRKG